MAKSDIRMALVLAPAQWGKHKPNNECYGHSLVVDPWGTVPAQAPDREEIKSVDLEFSALDRIRREPPSLANRRPAVYESRKHTIT